MVYFIFYCRNIDVNIYILCSKRKHEHKFGEKKLSILVSNIKDNNLNGVFEFVESFIDRNKKKKKTNKIQLNVLKCIGIWWKFLIFLPFVLLISSSRLRVASKSCTIASDISSNRLRSTSSGLNLPASSI